MRDITMKKSVLLEKLRENQKAHKAIFDEAVDGYKKQALALLEEHLQRIRDGKMIEVSVHLPVPENHTRDYDLESSKAYSLTAARMSEAYAG